MVALCDKQSRVILTSQGHTYVLRPLSHHNDVMRALNEQRKRGDKNLCDVTLVVGKSLMRAHKSVLAACSSYFQERFEQKKSIVINSDTSVQNGDGPPPKEITALKNGVTMSPPLYPVVKRRRNALSECIPESSASPAPPHSTSTPPPQFLPGRLRPPLIKPLSDLNDDMVILPGLKAKAVSLILDYMYTSELQINRENVQDLLLVSCLLQIKVVVEVCVKILTKESKWKISTSRFPSTNRPPQTSSSSSCPLRTSPARENQSEKKFKTSQFVDSYRERSSPTAVNSFQNSGNQIETMKNEKESSPCKRAELSQKRVSAVPAHLRPRDRFDDVTKLENLPHSGTCKMASAARAITIVSNASKSQFKCRLSSSSQQLPALPKVENSSSKSCLINENLKFPNENYIKSEPRCNATERTIRRNRTLSDSFCSPQEGALDLRRKQPSFKHSLSDDETRKIVSEESNQQEQKNNVKKEREASSISETSRGTALPPCVEPFRETKTDVKDSTIPQPRFFSADAAALKQLSHAENQPRPLPSTDICGTNLIFPYFPGFSALPSSNPYKNLAMNSQQSMTSSEVLKQIGLFANIPSQVPNFAWKDAAKFFALDPVSAPQELPVSTFENLQLHTWPNYSVLTPTLMQSQGLVNCFTSAQKFENPTIASYSPALNGTSESIEGFFRMSPTSSSKHSLPQQQVNSSVPSKHPLKRKLMMSATVGSSDSFRANSIDGGPPHKLSPKSVSPCITSFSTLRNPKSSGPTTRPRTCVM